MSALTQVNSSESATGTLQRLLEGAAGGALPEWARVAESMVVKRFDAGSEVFRQGGTHPYVYAVQSGLLKLAYLKEEGGEWVKSFAHEGRFFASIAALLAGGRTSFMVTALEDSVLERVDYRLLSQLANKHLLWSRALHNMTLIFASRKEQREMELLTLAPEARYLAFRAAEPSLEARITQKDLALYLGLTPVGLNRIVQRIRRAEKD